MAIKSGASVFVVFGAFMLSGCAVDEAYVQQAGYSDQAIEDAAERQDYECEYRNEPGSRVARKYCAPADELKRSQIDAKQDHRQTVLRAQNPLN